VPFQPTPDRTFAAADTLRVFGRAFWRSPDAALVILTIRPSPASPMQPTLVLSPARRGGQEAAFDAAVPLSGLAPGRYVLEVSARLSRGNAVTREVPFAIR
jgi:hypothetical protein